MSIINLFITATGRVAPFTGAWIEILDIPVDNTKTNVAPFTGAWIEIMKRCVIILAEIVSHPSRVRGLKFQYNHRHGQQDLVAPFTGAWIEMGPMAALIGMI